MAAVDSRSKRSAAISMAAPLGGSLQLPRPDTEITLMDRMLVLGVYPVLAAYAGGAVSPYIFGTTGVFQLRPDAATGRRGPGGRLKSFSALNVGTTMTVDVYDSDGAEENKIIEWVSADGKVNWLFSKDGLPLSSGLRVAVGGTPGKVLIEWD